MAASNSQFAHDWVDEKILNFLQFLQVPLRNAAAECKCDQLETLANQLQLASGAFILAEGQTKVAQKLALFGYAQVLQSKLVEPDESEGVERLEPEKLQAGYLPKYRDVHAEDLQQVCLAFAHVLQNMDYGKLARYLSFFGDQAFHTAKCMVPDPSLLEDARAQLSSGDEVPDFDGSRAMAGPSSI